MNSFFRLNRHKLHLMLAGVSIAFLILIILILSIGLAVGQTPKTGVLLSVVLIGVIMFPLFILLIAMIGWWSKRRTRERMFNTPPFDQLHLIGFTNGLINEDSRWQFTEETKAGIINGFQVWCDVKRDSPNTIEFNLKLNLSGNLNVNTLYKEVLKQGFQPGIDCIIVPYQKDQMGMLTLQQVKSDLEKATLLIQNTEL